MLVPKQPSILRADLSERILPNYWDFLAIIFVLSLIVLLGWGASKMVAPYHVGDPILISLEPHHLPYYAMRSFLRLLIAMFFSVLATFLIGTWAAKNRRAEMLIIPAIDVFQSVPVLSFLAITVVAFIELFPNSLLGPECAAIFAIFTAQVWNMILSFYQSIRTVPKSLREAAVVFQLSPWRQFWRIEVPFAMPGLIWNMMLSMSASWFFVVASEAISVSNQQITLPGIGSYIALAISQKNLHAILYALCTMLGVILLYDQLIFRPLSQWAERFYFTQQAEERGDRPWLFRLFMRTRLLGRWGDWVSERWDAFVNLSWFNQQKKTIPSSASPLSRVISNVCFYGGVVLAMLWSMSVLGRFIFATVPFAEMSHVLWLGCLTAVRVLILIMLCSLVWVPVGVWIGLRPKWRTFVQPIAQFLAAFPANLLFPLIVMLIIKYRLNPDIWTAPLMILGTQWYILFNVIAGAGSLPKELKQAAQSLGVKGWLWWRRFALPGIFPYFVTGAITAAGGSWNASIIAETVSWGEIKIQASGLGSYIAEVSGGGDFQRLALGTGLMCLYVLVINHLIWRPLYQLAQERYQP